MPEDTINAGNYTPITRALREYIERHPTMMHAVGLTDLCDNIDAIHKALEQKNAGMRDFCERTEQAAQAREDLTLWGVDYTALPVDADGVAIHVGDVMDWEYGGTFDVEGFGIEGLFYLDDARQLMWTNARTKHHHHEPTVEDVLREFYVLAVRGKEAHAEDVDEDVLAEYAAKLRLAGDAE